MYIFDEDKQFKKGGSERDLYKLAINGFLRGKLLTAIWP